MRQPESRRSFLKYAGIIFSSLGVARLFAAGKADSTSAPADSAHLAEAPKKKVAISLDKLKKIEKPGDGMILEL